MDSAIRLIEAIAKLIAAFAWPAAIIIGVWLVVGKQRDSVRRMLGRIKKFSYPGGEAELAEQVEEHRESIEQSAAELRELIPSPEEITEQIKKVLKDLQSAQAPDQISSLRERLEDYKATTRRRGELANRLIDNMIVDVDDMGNMIRVEQDSSPAPRVMRALQALTRVPWELDSAGPREGMRLIRNLTTVIGDEYVGPLLQAHAGSNYPELAKMIHRARNQEDIGRRVRDILANAEHREAMRQVARSTYRSIRKSGLGG